MVEEQLWQRYPRFQELTNPQPVTLDDLQKKLLKPGEVFEYTSGTAIATPVGTMRGAYQMTAEDGTQFEARIPEFTLAVPRVLH